MSQAPAPSGGQKHKIGLKSVAQAAAKSAKTGLSPKVGGGGGGAKKKVKPSVALMKVFPNELESQVHSVFYKKNLFTFQLSLFLPICSSSRQNLVTN